MKKDIKTRRDIERLVNHFYDKIKTDEVLSYLFNDVAKVNWEKHLPIMYDFWDNILFYKGGYKGNPMVKHQELNAKSPLSPEHFEQWNNLFISSVDHLFVGIKAEEIKERALNMSSFLMSRALN